MRSMRRRQVRLFFVCLVVATPAQGDDGPPPLSKPLVAPSPASEDVAGLRPPPAFAKPPVSAGALKKPRNPAITNLPESANPVVVAPPARPFMVVPAPGRVRGPAIVKPPITRGGLRGEHATNLPPAIEQSRPTESRGQGSVLEPTPEARARSGVQLERPLELEAAPTVDELPPPVLSEVAPATGTGRSQMNARAIRPGLGALNESLPRARDARPRSEVAPRTPEPKPEVQRPLGFFGRLFGSPPPVNPGRRNPATASEIRVEPRSDPAADAALKRRIERQIDARVGDRVGKVEVRVVGRNVVIRAHATRFWQRRSVRHEIESLPSLAGYHARVDIID